MICPICGAEVPDSRFCQNCGTLLASGQPATESAFASDTPDPAASEGQPNGVYQWIDVPQDPSRMRYAGTAPKTAFVLAIVGLVLSLLGFSFVTIVPGLALSIVALVLNSRYVHEGRDNPRRMPTNVLGIAGIVVAALMAVALTFAGTVALRVYSEYEQNGNLHDLVDELEGSQDAPSPEGGDTSSEEASHAGQAVLDPRTFDALGNPTLYALCDLNGYQLQSQLEASGYVWVEGASSWVSSEGSLVEVQDRGGMMARDDIAELDVGASGSSTVYVVVVAGYDTSEAALVGVSGDVEMEGSYSASDGDIAMSVVRGADGKERLVAVTETGSGQHTVLAFTEEAVEDGLFAEITGVDAGDSIDEVWEVVQAG